MADISGGDAFFNIGVAHVRRGDSAGAVSAFGEAIRRGPVRVHYYAHLGRALLAADDAETAALCFEHAIRLEPSNPYYYQLLGVCLFHGDDFAAAALSFQGALALAPQDAAAWGNFGAALLYTARFREAAQALHRGLALAPRAEVHFNLALALYGLGDLAGARDSLHHALELNPAMAGARHTLAFIERESIAGVS